MVKYYWLWSTFTVNLQFVISLGRQQTLLVTKLKFLVHAIFLLCSIGYWYHIYPGCFPLYFVIFPYPGLNIWIPVFPSHFVDISYLFLSSLGRFKRFTMIKNPSYLPRSKTLLKLFTSGHITLICFGLVKAVV